MRPLGHQSRESFWFVDRNCSCVTRGPKKIRLAPDSEEVWQLWQELMARPPEQPNVVVRRSSVVVAEIDQFLDRAEANSTPRA